MKKLVFFLLAAVALCSCESNDEPCPVTGIVLPASSTASPITPGETVTISGVGFAPDCGILLRSGKTDTETDILDVTASSLRFRAPIVSGTQSVILTQNGGSWNLGKLVFPQADKIPFQILPKKVSRIQSTIPGSDADESMSSTIRYGYDNEGRIVSIHEHWEEKYDGIVEVSENEWAIEYAVDRITMNDVTYNSINYFELADGRATNYNYGHNSDGLYTYDSNGYISQIIYTDGDGTYVYTVTDGSLTQIKCIEESETYAQLTFNNNPAQSNNLNIDLFGIEHDLFECDEGLHISCLLGINGERFRTLPTKITRKTYDDNITETYTYRYTMNGEYISKVEMYEERKGKQKLINCLEFFYEE